jgi:Zn-dependent protease with chaperone function
MTYFLLVFCLAVLAFGAASALLSLLILPLLRRAASAAEPRGDVLLALRWTPTLLAALFVGIRFLPAFLHLEPRQTSEEVSGAMLALTAACALTLVAGPVRGLLSILATWRLTRRWRRQGTPVKFPGVVVPALAVDGEGSVAAVAGIVRPRLVIDRSVLARCTWEEILAIAAHEGGHVLHRDNLKRLLLRSCPDLLALTPFASFVERAWSGAADRAADDHAAALVGRLDLAAALVKVARLVSDGRVRDVPLLAFCGEGIAGRVKRLLGPPPPPRSRDAGRALRIAFAIVLALVVVALDRKSSRDLYAVTETVVQALQ